MKIAVLSDIHGNLPALEAVIEHINQWQPDQVVVNGDVVNRGPNSAETYTLATSQPNWHILRGNHEDYVASYVNGGNESHALSRWTFERLGVETTHALDALPDGMGLPTPYGEVRFRHASMLGNQDCVWEDSEPSELQKQIAPAPAVFCTAHTHRPWVRQLGGQPDGTLILNTGSVGTTLAGYTKANYAQLEHTASGWQATIQKVDYDVDRAARDYDSADYFTGVGPFGRLVFEEWRQAQPIIPAWYKRFGPALKAGDIDLATSVAEFLALQER